jgi:hypothetical protein
MTDGTYVITVRGVAGPWVRAASCDVAVSAVGDTTVLRRAGTGQAALHGLLRRVQDLGLDVLGVHLEPAEPASGTRSRSAAGQDTGARHGRCIRGSEAT